MISHIWNVWKQRKQDEPNPDRGWITINKALRFERYIERVFDWIWWDILVLSIKPLRGWWLVTIIFHAFYTYYSH